MGVLVTVSWAPTPGMKAQHLAVTVNGAAQPSVALEPGAVTHSFQANPGDKVDVDVWADDGVLCSHHATATLSIPQAPPAPTGLALSFAQQ